MFVRRLPPQLLFACLIGLNAVAQAQTAPSDDIETATVISNLPFTAIFDMGVGTDDENDPDVDCSGSYTGSSLWYLYVAQVDESIDLLTTDITGWGLPETVVYSGEPGELTQVACPHSYSYNDLTRLDVTAGESYYIMAAQDYWPDPEEGELPTQLTVKPTPEPTQGPATIIGAVKVRRTWEFVGDIYLYVPIQNIDFLVSISCPGADKLVEVSYQIEQNGLSYKSSSETTVCLNAGNVLMPLHLEEGGRPQEMLRSGVATISLNAYAVYNNYTASTGEARVPVLLVDRGEFPGYE